MSRLYLEQIWLLCLMEKYEKDERGYLTKERAYQALKADTGQDFGYDIEAWKTWLINNRRQQIRGVIDVFGVDMLRPSGE